MQPQSLLKPVMSAELDVDLTENTTFEAKDIKIFQDQEHTCRGRHPLRLRTEKVEAKNQEHNRDVIMTSFIFSAVNC